MDVHPTILEMIKQNPPPDDFVEFHRSFGLVAFRKPMEGKYKGNCLVIGYGGVIDCINLISERNEFHIVSTTHDKNGRATTPPVVTQWMKA